LVNTFKIGESIWGVHPGYSPENSTLHPDSSKAERKALAKSHLELSTEDRVRQEMVMVPSFTITLAILLDVSKSLD